MSKIITQQLEKLKSINSKIFIFIEQLEQLQIYSKKENKLNKLEKLINEIDISYYSEQIDEMLHSMKSAMKVSIKLNKKHYKKEEMQQYAKYSVDPKNPIIIDRNKEPEFFGLTYEELQEKSLKETGILIQPIDRKIPIEYTGTCKHCDAPNEYIYRVDLNRFLCKCCKNRFAFNIRKHAELSVICPYCDRTCDQQKDKDNYYVYRCRHNDCKHFLKNKKLVKTGKGEHLKVDAKHYKLRYTYRYHKTDLSELNESAIKLNNGVDIRKIHHSPRVLGLVLTYVINYGLSYRKASMIMNDVHGVRISPATIYRYIFISSKSLEYFVENHEYDLSNEIGADETYIKSRGRNKYVFFYSDLNQKIITSYRIFNNRSSKECLVSMFQTFKKFKGNKIPENLSITVDANPIYMYCQNYFKHHGINFDLRIVTGVKNKDESSVKYRKGKQIQERLNRTYKANYHGTNGYDSIESANSYMILFVAFFNFLRVHSSLNYKTPVQLDFLSDIPLMQDKWISLIDQSLLIQSNILTAN